MSVNRDIFCNCCGTYVGTLRDAKIIKGLKFVCPKCQSKTKKESNEDVLSWFSEWGNFWK